MMCGLALIAGCVSAPSRLPQVIYPEVTSTHPLSQPEYPGQSRVKAEQGLVGVDVLVSEYGRVQDAKIVLSSGHEALDASTLKEARTWQLMPGRVNGRYVAMWKLFVIPFSLNDGTRPMPDQSQALAEVLRMNKQRSEALEAEAAAAAAGT